MKPVARTMNLETRRTLRQTSRSTVHRRTARLLQRKHATTSSCSTLWSNCAQARRLLLRIGMCVMALSTARNPNSFAPAVEGIAVRTLNDTYNKSIFFFYSFFLCHLCNSLTINVPVKPHLSSSKTSPFRLQNLSFRVAKLHLLQAQS